MILRNQQVPPEDTGWLTWLVLGGRGAGKTRLGAEWVHGLATGIAPFATEPTSPIALIGETFTDVREIMIDGPAGVLSCAKLAKPKFETTRRRLVWPNGAVAQAFSAEDPESLRGPQFSAAWCDEVGKWVRARACWDMLQFGLRLGSWPRQLVTTTPRPIELIRELMEAKSTVLTRMRTAENANNLAPSFLSSINERYLGTHLGRQELDGELIEQREDALWTRSLLDKIRRQPTEELGRVVVAVDPPATSKAQSDACGILVAGTDGLGKAHVLADHTVQGVKPFVWASRVIAAYHAARADVILAEVNQGGDMVASIIHSIDPSVNVKAVRASRGKWLRAEPVAALYEQDRVRHCSDLRALEDEMCDFGPGGLSTGRSPDRLDALVWALTHLLLAPRSNPRVRDIS